MRKSERERERTQQEEKEEEKGEQAFTSSLPLQRKGDEEDDNRNAFQRNFFGAFLVMFFTHVILTATGNITSAGPGWRVVQSVVTIGFYLWRLYQVTQDEDVVGLKRD